MYNHMTTPTMKRKKEFSMYSYQGVINSSPPFSNGAAICKNAKNHPGMYNRKL